MNERVRHILGVVLEMSEQQIDDKLSAVEKLKAVVQGLAF